MNAVVMTTGPGVGRRLARVGAVAVKPGVYALPAGEEHREDFAWILREVCDGGGEAQIVEARLVDGLDDVALIERSALAGTRTPPHSPTLSRRWPKMSRARSRREISHGCAVAWTRSSGSSRRGRTSPRHDESRLAAASVWLDVLYAWFGRR